MIPITPIDYTIQEKINARLLSAGNKVIDQVKEDKYTDRVHVYCYAIQSYDYIIANVDIRYINDVKTKFGI